MIRVGKKNNIIEYDLNKLLNNSKGGVSISNATSITLIIAQTGLTYNEVLDLPDFIFKNLLSAISIIKR